MTQKKTMKITTLAPDGERMMTEEQYRAALARLELSQVSGARYVRVNPRTSRRFAEDGPPDSVAKLLLLTIALKLTPEEADKLIAKVRL